MERRLTRPATPATLVRPTLRFNVFLMVLGMLVLPQAIVVAWSFLERDIGGTLEWQVRQACADARDALTTVPDDESRTRLLGEVASRYGTRVRLVAEDGREHLEADFDQSTDVVHQIGTLFFGPDGAPTLRQFDETLGPVPRRDEVVLVTGWVSPAPKAPAPLPEGSAHTYPFGTSRTSIPGGPAPVSTLFKSPAPPSPITADVASGCRTSPAGKLLVCHAARTVVIDGRTEVLYAQRSSRRAVRALYDLRYHLLRLSLVMLPLALGFSWWMGRRMVRPIEWLRERVVQKARDANPSADLVHLHGDEVGDLADAFNDLLGALDERRRANEGFVADLVHEFKNPVAAIRACAESLDGGAVDERRSTRLAKILHDSSKRLDALVSEFLELARAEAGLPNEARSRVDLAALASGVVDSVRETFPEVTFVVHAPLAVSVHGVESRLESVLRNLVDNAASFATGGTVTVVVSSEAERAVVRVADTGPGIRPEDRPHVFDRFFTTRATSGDDARVRARSGHGTGLGLALVKAIVEAHGGQVSADPSPEDGGATFRVVLPTG